MPAIFTEFASYIFLLITKALLITLLVPSSHHGGRFCIFGIIGQSIKFADILMWAQNKMEHYGNLPKKLTLDKENWSKFYYFE